MRLYDLAFILSPLCSCFDSLAPMLLRLCSCSCALGFYALALYVAGEVLREVTIQSACHLAPGDLEEEYSISCREQRACLREKRINGQFRSKAEKPQHVPTLPSLSQIPSSQLLPAAHCRNLDHFTTTYSKVPHVLSHIGVPTC